MSTRVERLENELARNKKRNEELEKEIEKAKVEEANQNKLKEEKEADYQKVIEARDNYARAVAEFCKKYDNKDIITISSISSNDPFTLTTDGITGSIFWGLCND